MSEVERDLTAHELARLLLAGPDAPVLAGEFESTDSVRIVVPSEGAVTLHGTWPFCEAAYEWDHDWAPGVDGLERCRECGIPAAGQ